MARKPSAMDVLDWYEELVLARPEDFPLLHALERRRRREEFDDD